MRLRNPHLSLGPSGGKIIFALSLPLFLYFIPSRPSFHLIVVDGTQHLVRGDYLYYHYGQDGFDDKGWGCSYRSLQTLCSWFQLQHYSSKLVPSHPEIQEILVQMGDKQADFAGSKNWIGSVELSLILDQLFGVQCKIFHLSSGLEFSSKVREIIHHFDTQGTPIMIGGGVLAYTLLGVDYCEVTDAVRWLILDPHYTGGEELRTVIDKGWCTQGNERGEETKTHTHTHTHTHTWGCLCLIVCTGCVIDKIARIF
jgi:hypothetical protein